MYVWFDALLNYVTALTFAREGEDLTEPLLAGRPARDGEGHPQVPRGDLAGAALGGGPRAAAADGDPRLPADGREEDVEVARQRARPVRGDRALRRRRAALLLLPRGQLRPGRLDLHRRLRGALRDRAGQRLRQPGEPRARRWSTATAPASCRWRRSTRCSPRTSKAPSAASRDAARPGRAEPGAGGGLEAGAPPQPLRRGDEAVGAGQGRGRPRAPRRGPLQPGRGPAGDDAAARALPAATAERVLGALGEESRALAELGSRPGGQRIERDPAAVPEDRGSRPR